MHDSSLENPGAESDALPAAASPERAEPAADGATMCRDHRYTRWFAWATLIVTYVGIVTGGIVTSTESGMADRHAPLFDGGWIPDFARMARDPDLLLEHGHRLLMATSGLRALIAGICGWFAPGPGVGGQPRRWVSKLGIAMALLVLPPATFGALTVLMHLHPALSVTHVSLAMLFIAVAAALAVVTGRHWYEDSIRLDLQTSHVLAWLAVLNLVATYVQIVIGAIPRHARADVGGTLMVAIGNAIHIVWAFVVFAILVLLVGRVMGIRGRPQRLLRPAILLLLGLILQVFLGFATFLVQPKEPAAVVVEKGELVATGSHVVFATIHQAIGVLVLIVSVALALRALRVRYFALQGVQNAEGGGDIATGLQGGADAAG